jgi:hypothetical protein
MRRPSISTRLRSGPRLRRLTYMPPKSREEVSDDARLMLGAPAAVTSCRMSATLM